MAALAATGVAAPALAPLQTVAGGAPTRDALRAELRKNRRAMAEENTAQPENWREQALRLAGRIVSVQRVDSSAPETPAALVATSTRHSGLAILPPPPQPGAPCRSRPGGPARRLARGWPHGRPPRARLPGLARLP